MLQEKLLADELGEEGLPLDLASCSSEIRSLHIELGTAFLPVSSPTVVAEGLTQLVQPFLICRVLALKTVCITLFPHHL